MFPKKVTDNRVKNTKRKILKSVKEMVYERDGGSCVFCKKSTQDHFHHIYWGMEAEYGIDRNEANKLVLCCQICHNKCHFSDESERYRLMGKVYLSIFYGKR